MASNTRSSELTTRRRKLNDLKEKLTDKYQVPEMEVQELSERSNSDIRPVVIDIRNEAEQLVSMIPQAITQVEFERDQDTFKDASVVCYCTVGMRSSAYARQLKNQGWEAYNLRGSIMSWTQEGLPLVKGTDRKTPTKEVHAYAENWAFEGDGYTHVTYSMAPARMVVDAVKSLLPKWL